MKNQKYSLLKKGLLYDAIGMVTMAIPFVGPFLDILWAPYAAKKMSEMYKGEMGKVASVVVFVEEILPVMDFVPTFTLMWAYTYILKNKKRPLPGPIEVEIVE
ncbi:MAG: hypothetical protein ACPG7E_07165 [Marinirhabdus sp.]